MKEKVGIFVDAGYITIVLHKVLGRRVDANSIHRYCKGLLNLPPLKGSQLFRIYYYDCPSIDDEFTDPNGKVINFSKSSGARYREKVRDELRQLSNVAIRTGELTFKGWIPDGKQKIYKPIFKQKQVDMKNGLDIAWASMKGIVSKIILISGDSDFIPAMKFARREGINVYLDNIGQHTLKSDMKTHADIILYNTTASL